MTQPILDAKNFDDHRQHWITVRVYYEDNDFTGMVYHANYLRFFERGRSDHLRDAGISHQSLLDREDPAAFTLTNVKLISATDGWNPDLTVFFLKPGETKKWGWVSQPPADKRATVSLKSDQNQ